MNHCDRGKDAGGEEGDAGLVAERGEVVHPGEASRLPTLVCCEPRGLPDHRVDQ